MAAIGRFQKGDSIFYAKVVDGEIYPLRGDVFGSPSFEKKPMKLKGVRTLTPVTPSKIIAVGLNYADHARESGKPLPKQHGAPLRLVVPWKYGYKSIKSIVKIEFTAQQPKTFWETLAPEEYPFESNVNPAKPHPRWSQATERLIDTGDRVKTQPFNGYGGYVAKMYSAL